MSQNPQAAAGYYAQACANQDGDGCHGLGMLLTTGRGVTQDIDKAIETLEKGCDYGVAKACAAAGTQLWEHRQSANHARIERLFSKACKLGAGKACVNLGDYHRLLSDAPHAAKKALRLYSAACVADDGQACFLAGVVRARKFGDFTQARRDFTKSCALSESNGCVALGSMMLSGAGGAKDIAGGAAKLRETCAANVARGCHLYGIAIRQGLVHDTAMAATNYLQKACDLGDPQACSEITR